MINFIYTIYFVSDASAQYSIQIPKSILDINRDYSQIENQAECYIREHLNPSIDSSIINFIEIECWEEERTW